MMVPSVDLTMWLAEVRFKWLLLDHDPALRARVDGSIVDEAAACFAWGYPFEVVVAALRAGCVERYEMASFCDTNGGARA